MTVERKEENRLGRKIGARLFGTGWVAMGGYFGYTAIDTAIQIIQQDIPVASKVAGVGATLLLTPVGGCIIAEGVSDIITGRHHSLSHPLWKKLKESRKSSMGESLGSRELLTNVSYVYHVTHSGCLESIFREGLLPQYSVHREPTETFMDQFAPDGFSRRGAVYAYPDITSAREKRGFTSLPEEVIIQVTVDPKKVLVSRNFEMYSRIEDALKRGDFAEAAEAAADYWNGTLTLEEYLRIPESERQHFLAPEAIIPGALTAEHLKVVI